VLDGIVAPFERFLDETGSREVLDLGAGGGGPARILTQTIARAGRTPPLFLLTDLHPRIGAWSALKDENPQTIDFAPISVDATRIPHALSDGRTRALINVLHHFTPELAAAILEDAVRGGHGVFVVEGFERDPRGFASFALAGLPALMLNPVLSRHHRLAKMALTWLTPAALAMSVWDGVVSTLRIHSEADLRAMVAPFGGAWRWEYGTYEFFPGGKGSYFYGVPRVRATAVRAA
jgi:hypothetical protein